jgi:hypothetical protein
MDGGELLLGTTSPVLLCLGYVGGLEPLYQRQEPEQPLEANDRTLCVQRRIVVGRSRLG